MPSFEKICQAVFSDTDLLRKVLIGGLLTYVPFVNILVLGYLYRYTQQIRDRGDFNLPQWDDFPRLIVDGLRFFVLKLIILFPLFLVASVLWWMTDAVFRLVRLDVLANTVAFLPFSIVILLGVPLLFAALFRLQTRGRFNTLLKWERVVRLMLRTGPLQLIAVLCFMGLIFVGWPLFGFAAFFGSAILCAYFTTVHTRMSKELETVD